MIVNAASKGHLPIVLYLLSKQFADPLIRNDWGETAYDIAAAVFEIWICEVTKNFDALYIRANGETAYIIGPSADRGRKVEAYDRIIRSIGGTHYCASHSL